MANENDKLLFEKIDNIKEDMSKIQISIAKLEVKEQPALSCRDYVKKKLKEKTDTKISHKTFWYVLGGIFSSVGLAIRLSWDALKEAMK